MRIAVHDYGFFPFILELSSELSRRGHHVRHFYFSQNATPQAVAHKGDGISPLTCGLRIKGTFRKWSLIQRYFQEREYGAVVAKAISEFAPDIVISANTPIDAQAAIHALCRRRNIPYVLWLQDVVSIAMAKILSKRLPVFGALIGRFYQWREARLLRNSAAVLLITPDFLDICATMAVPKTQCTVIENWAPLGEITPRKRLNRWSDEQGLSDKRVILYSGTIGYKHSPAIFERLALHFQSQPDVRVVVISEGLGAAWLSKRKAAMALDNMILLPFQPYDRLSEVLNSGDLLLAILDEDAGIFCVPSKVLTYLAAGRPILLSSPSSNHAAEVIRRAGAGRIVAPDDHNALVGVASDLLADPGLCAELGRNSRQYAERHFEIRTIADKIERLLVEILAKHENS